MNERDELLAAVRNTDISFFGFIYDLNRNKLIDESSPSLTIEDLNRTAFEQTVTHPIIARVGIEAVIEAQKSGTCGTKHFSPASRQALESFIKSTQDPK